MTPEECYLPSFAIDAIRQLMCDMIFTTLNDMSDENLEAMTGYLKDNGFTNKQINSSIDRLARVSKNWKNFKQPE